MQCAVRLPCAMLTGAAPPLVVFILAWHFASACTPPSLLSEIFPPLAAAGNCTAPSPQTQVMLDFHVCSWRSQPGLSTEDDSLAAHFDKLNEPAFSAALQVRGQALRARGKRRVETRLGRPWAHAQQ